MPLRVALIAFALLSAPAAAATASADVTVSAHVVETCRVTPGAVACDGAPVSEPSPAAIGIDSTGQVLTVTF